MKRFLLASLAFFGVAISASAQTPTRPFLSTSFWYQPIPRVVPLHPNSSNLVRDFLRQKSEFYNNVDIKTTSYSSPVYTVGQNVTPVTVKQWDCHGSGYFEKRFETDWSAVPIPAYALPANGTDAEMTIYQPSTNTMWEFWRARKTAAGGWEACWGGRMTNVPQNPGIWEPASARPRQGCHSSAAN